MSGTPTLPAQPAEREAFHQWASEQRMDTRRVPPGHGDGSECYVRSGSDYAWAAWQARAALASGATQPSEPHSWFCQLKAANGSVLRSEYMPAKYGPMKGNHGIEGCNWFCEPLHLATPPTGEPLPVAQWQFKNQGRVWTNCTPAEANEAADLGTEIRSLYLGPQATGEPLTAPSDLRTGYLSPDYCKGFDDGQAVLRPADPWREHLAQQAENIGRENLRDGLMFMGVSSAGEGQEEFSARLGENANRLTQAVCEWGRAALAATAAPTETNRAGVATQHPADGSGT